MFLFVYRKKTAYVRRISDWSSDVCSYDLLSVHLFSFAEVERARCRLAPSRTLLKDDNQRAGFHPVNPFNENVINSARPPMLSTGTGPPSPSSSRLTRLSADRSRLSPIRNRWSDGILIGPYQSSA